VVRCRNILKRGRKRTKKGEKKESIRRVKTEGKGKLLLTE
jgi:hypothetical protein